ncbi:hypothetical protein BDK92_7201 [Micromonospora pisi]|uniref:Uncharacterized protein n=1 Tax=Micromonospora pisi TaxID=589240 RepID=A0A495JUP9_9ACTN|nr:hypothetical protein [Micromonospora pisi]RKR92723.1 hypothetical protein BDK92_7201 [Micromonospora pisi]
MADTTKVRTRSEAFRVAVAELMAVSEDDYAFTRPDAEQISKRTLATAIASAQDVPRLADDVDRLTGALRDIEKVAAGVLLELAVTMPDAPESLRNLLNTFRDRAHRAVTNG